MKNKFLSVVIVFVLTASSFINCAHASGYGLELDKTEYFQDDVMTLSISVPDESMIYAIEVLKGNTVILHIPFTASAGNTGNLYELPIADDWEYGDDYTIRVGRGEDFVSASFILSQIIEVENISITNKSEFTNVKINSAANRINYTITPNDATNKTVTFTSSNASVATVDDDGLVSFLETGSITITITASNGKSDSVTFTISRGSSGTTTDGYVSSSVGPTPTPTPTAEPTTTPNDSNNDSGGMLDKFADINENDWFYNDVKFAVDSGLFNGVSENEFAPEESMTRAMILTVLARYASVDTAGGEQWWSKAAQWGLKNGITDGTNLEDNVTREQLVALLWRYTGKPTGTADLSNFSDDNTISDWAADDMKWAVEAGLISGYPDGTLHPEGNITRAEVAAIIHRFATLKTIE